MRVFVILLVVALAGCFETPDVPEHATVSTDSALPGLRLSAWVEVRGGFTYLHAVAENDGGPVETKEDCGYLWQSTLRRNGTVVEYREPREETCDWWYDTLRSGDHREFLHSWDGRLWNGTDAYEAPPGDYAWTVLFLLRDGSEHETQAPRPDRFLAATISFSR